LKLSESRVLFGHEGDGALLQSFVAVSELVFVDRVLEDVALLQVFEKLGVVYRGHGPVVHAVDGLDGSELYLVNVSVLF